MNETKATKKDDASVSMHSSSNNPQSYVSKGIKEEPTFGNLKAKKAEFDELHNYDVEITLKKGVQSICHLYDLKRPFSASSVIQNEVFCDWYPELFGIDEDQIPDSEREGLFDWEELEGSESDESSTDGEKTVTEEYRKLKYGRRPREKPVLETERHGKYRCLCKIDKNYSRHYICHFGKRKKGEELRTPNFRVFWENLNERIDVDEQDRWSNIFEPPEPEPEIVKGLSFKITPKFPGSTKQSIKNFRLQLLSTFRPLSCREVRRHRMPFAEALYLELQEDEFLDSAEFFKNIIIQDHHVHETSLNLGKPLRDNRVMMKRVVAFLMLSEKLCQKQKFESAVLVLLRSGKYFNDFDQNWWWLAEEFYKKALEVSLKSKFDGGKTEAISNYILGTFFLDYVHRMQPAQEHLLRARELSIDKDWNAQKILKNNQDTIYNECGNHLCRALIAVSKELREQGKPEEALPHICRSHKLCQETNTSRWDIQMETYFELGLTYQEVGYYEWALTAFKKYQEYAISHKLNKNICDAFLELAITYKRAGDFPRCLRHILSFLKFAESNGDENLIAFGNRYLGEFYLDQGNPKLAAEHLKKSFLSFLNQFNDSKNIPFKEWQQEHFNLGNDVELTRVLIGLAYGGSLTKPICDLIVSAKDKNQKSISKLIDWKNFPEKYFYSTDWEVQYEDEDDYTFPAVIEEPSATKTILRPADTRKKVEVSEISVSEDQELKTVRFAV